MNRFYILLFFLILVVSAQAQQETQFTHFTYNQQLLNPAYSGSQGYPSFFALYRKQWLGFEGAPQAQVLSFSTPVVNDRQGFGASAFHQKVGIIDNWNMNLAYSYKLQLVDDLSLRLGVQGTLKYYQLDFSDPNQVIFDQDDPSIADGMQVNRTRGGVGVGLYLQHPSFHVGVSSPQILPNSIGFNEEAMLTAKEAIHVFGLVGGNFPVSESIELRPSVLVKYVQDAPITADVNLMLSWQNLLSAGVSYRSGGTGTGESVDFLVFYQLSDKAGVGVAYDFSISEFASYNSGSIEAVFRYDLKKPPMKEQEEKVPNFF